MKQSKAIEYLQYLGKRKFKGYALYITCPDKELTMPVVHSFTEENDCKTFILCNQDVVVFFASNKMQDMLRLSLRVKNSTPEMKSTVHIFTLKTEHLNLYNKIYRVEVQEERDFSTLNILKKIPKKILQPEKVMEIIFQIKQGALEDLIAEIPVWNEVEQQVQFTLTQLNIADVRQRLFPEINLTISPPYLVEILQEAVARKLAETVCAKNTAVEIFTFFSESLLSVLVEKAQYFIWDGEDVFSHWQQFKEILEKTKAVKHILSVKNPSSFWDMDFLPVDYLKINVDKIEFFEEKIKKGRTPIIVDRVNTEKNINQCKKYRVRLLCGTAISKMCH